MCSLPSHLMMMMKLCSSSLRLSTLLYIVHMTWELEYSWFGLYRLKHATPILSWMERFCDSQLWTLKTLQHLNCSTLWCSWVIQKMRRTLCHIFLCCKWMQRVRGEPLRVFLELEASPHRSGSEDLFVSYHASSSVQVTYAGASFHVVRNYYVSPVKQTVRFLKQALLSLVFLYFQHLL